VIKINNINIPHIQEASSWDIDEPDIWRPYHLAKSLVEYLDADETVKDQADFAADRIKDELETALAHYQTITSSNFQTLNLSKQRAAYESLYSDLWTLYKDRMQHYLKVMKIDIGFLFVKDEDFQEYATNFIKSNPNNGDFVEFAQKQRDGWQNDLARNRNAHEHKGDLRGNVKDFENPNEAARLFAQVCWSFETTIASLVSWKLRRGWNVIEGNPRSTVFDRCERYVIEHAAVTNQKQK
jgi:hypothetical protein